MSHYFVPTNRFSENSQDNENYSLIVSLHDSFVGNNGDIYIIQDLVGSGSFAGDRRSVHERRPCGEEKNKAKACPDG